VSQGFPDIEAADKYGRPTTVLAYKSIVSDLRRPPSILPEPEDYIGARATAHGDARSTRDGRESQRRHRGCTNYDLNFDALNHAGDRWPSSDPLVTSVWRNELSLASAGTG